MGPALFAIVVGLVVLATGVLGLVRRLPRNRFVGVRTGATNRSDAAFRVGNRASAPAVILGGALAAASGVVALFVPARAVTGCVVAGVLLMCAFALLGAVQANRAVNRG